MVENKIVKKRGKGQKIQLQEKIAIFEKLKALAMSGTLHGYSITALCEQFDLSRDTMKKQLAEFYSMVEVEDINIIYLDFRILFDRLFRESYRVLNTAADNTERDKAIRLVADLVDKKTTMMERFGKKEKVADMVAITVERQLVIDNVLDVEDAEVTESG